MLEGRKLVGPLILFFFYLDREWQSIFFESIKIKNKLLSSFSQRGQISIAININRFSFKNLAKQEIKDNKTSFNSRFMHISIMIFPRQFLSLIQVPTWPQSTTN